MDDTPTSIQEQKSEREHRSVTIRQLNRIATLATIVSLAITVTWARQIGSATIHVSVIMYRWVRVTK